MSKLALMARDALKSRIVFNSPAGSNLSGSSRFFPPCFTKAFSTEGAFSPPPKDIDSQSQVFGRVSITSKNALKTDLIHYLEGCNLSSADVKVEYNRSYAPISMIVQFPSQSQYDLAQKQTLRKGRLYKLEMVDRYMWESLHSYEGKWIFLHGLPRGAGPEDVDRFLSGCNYDPSIELMLRPFGANNLVKCALVRFNTALDAMHAFTTKNNRFCQNSPVKAHLLQ